MGDFSRGFEDRNGSNEEGPQWCDVQVSIPMLYSSSCVEKQYGNMFEHLGFWEADPSMLMAFVQPQEQQILAAPPPPPYVAAIHAPTMHPNLVSTLKSLIDVDATVVVPKINGRESNRGFEVENNNNNKDEDIAIVPVDLIQNRRPFRCAHGGCNKTFKNPQTLKMHHKTHFSEEGGVIHVENPHKGKGNRAGHNKKIPSRCPVCRRTFVGLYELRRHFGRKHTEGEKMHACRKCGKRFYIEVDLRDHEKLCGEPIECKCGMKFAFKCNLVAHKKSHPECQDPSSSSSADDCKTSSSNCSFFQHTSAAKINSNEASITGNVMAGAEGLAEMPVMVSAGGVKLEDIDLCCINRGVCS